MESKDKKGIMNVRGIIGPSNWDAHGNVIGISIFTFDENEYTIDKEGFGRDLSSYLHKEAELIGVLKSGDKRKKFKVESFRIINAS